MHRSLRDMVEAGLVTPEEVALLAEAAEVPHVKALVRVIEIHRDALRVQNEERMTLNTVEVALDCRAINGQIRECNYTLGRFSEAREALGAKQEPHE